MANNEKAPKNNTKQSVESAKLREPDSEHPNGRNIIVKQNNSADIHDSKVSATSGDQDEQKPIFFVGDKVLTPRTAGGESEATIIEIFTTPEGETYATVGWQEDGSNKIKRVPISQLKSQESTNSEGGVDERDKEIADLRKEIEDLKKQLKEVNKDNQEKDEELNLDFYDYSEQYAKVKNLLGAKKATEMLHEESKKTQQQLTEYVHGKITEYLEKNTNATKEQIAQEQMKYYVDANSRIQEEILAALNGEERMDKTGEKRSHGGPFRKFNAIMDKHGKKIKKALLVVGGAGAVVVTGGLIFGAAAPALALGAGTAVGAGVGAIKGAITGGIMTRHGGEKSAVKDLQKYFESDQEIQKMLEKLDANDKQTYLALSGKIMEFTNQAAEFDHKHNVDITRKGMAISAGIGALLGAVGGSTYSETTISGPEVGADVPNDNTVPQEVPNAPLEIPHHTIQPGELTGQVIQNTLNDMGLGGQYNFVMPDGSTNMDLIYQFDPNWDTRVHSFAGADNLSDEGIRAILENIASQNAGTHIEYVNASPDPQPVSSSSETVWVGNTPAVIGSWLAGVGLGGAAAKTVADRSAPAGAAATLTDKNGKQTSVKQEGQEPMIKSENARGIVAKDITGAVHESNDFRNAFVAMAARAGKDGLISNKDGRSVSPSGARVIQDYLDTKRWEDLDQKDVQVDVLRWLHDSATKQPVPRLSMEDFNNRVNGRDDVVRQGLREVVNNKDGRDVLLSDETLEDRANQVIINLFNTDRDEFFSISDPRKYSSKISPTKAINLGADDEIIGLSSEGKRLFGQYASTPAFVSDGLEGFVDYLRGQQIQESQEAPSETNKNIASQNEQEQAIEARKNEIEQTINDGTNLRAVELVASIPFTDFNKRPISAHDNGGEFHLTDIGDVKLRQYLNEIATQNTEFTPIGFLEWLQTNNQ